MQNIDKSESLLSSELMVASDAWLSDRVRQVVLSRAWAVIFAIELLLRPLLTNGEVGLLLRVLIEALG